MDMGSRLGSFVMKLGAGSSPDDYFVDNITLFVALLCASIVTGHLLEKNRWMNESIATLFIGLCTGAIILLTTKGKSSRVISFNEDVFFLYLLPPIIFNAGFQVKKKKFFENFITIMMFGVVGTLISFAIISLGALHLFKKMDIGLFEIDDYLALGTIFAATDSVSTLQVLSQDETPLLYSLVFGEGVVNDATSVVLFNAIQRFALSDINSGVALQIVGSFLYLFLSSTFLGVFIGLISAYIIKKLYMGRHSTDREIALMILMAYLSYMMAELFYLSGILTVFFCGIVMSHYTWHNVTENSRVATRHCFATLSFIAEKFIFLYVGTDALDIEKWRSASKSPGTSFAVSATLFGLLVVGRAASVFPLSFLSNLTRTSHDEKISLRQQIIIWWSGLMRGAVSLALAYNQFARSGHTQMRGNAIMITSTITVVLFSMVVFGLLTNPMIRFLLPPKFFSSMNSNEPSSPKSYALPLLNSSGHTSEADTNGHYVPRPASLRTLLTTPTYTVHHYWRRFDDAFMRPMFGGRGFVPLGPVAPMEMTLN